MRVQTYTFTVELYNGDFYIFPKMSRVAVARYKEWFEGHCQVLAFVTREDKLRRGSLI